MTQMERPKLAAKRPAAAAADPAATATADPPRKRTRAFPPQPSVAPHPLGIRPMGNLLFARSEPGFVDTRGRGLGPFARFDDEFLLAFLVTYLDDPRALCALGRASKAWYAFWAYDEIWKGWVLERWRDLPPGGPVPKVYVPTGWRHTYIHLVVGTPVEQLAQSPLVADPVQIPHLYSDLLFHPHLYASTPLAYLVDMLEALTATGVVRAMDAVDRPSVDAFVAAYEAPNKPCILRGCMAEWPAMRGGAWNWDALASRLGDVPLRAEAVDMLLAEYLAYMNAHPADEAPVYLFDKDYPKQGAGGCELAAGYTVPPYFTADLFSVLGATRPDYSWLIVGPERSGSSHHKDPNSTSAWNAVIRGAKLWLMYPPDLVPPGVFPSADGANVSTPVSLMDWWLNWFPQTRQLVRGVPRDRRPVWAVCREGEIAFVPCGWWHTVINLEPSIAITQNYVSQHNLRSVLEFLFCNREMISGYGNADDAADTVGGATASEDNAATEAPAAATSCAAAPSTASSARPGGNGNCVDARRLYEDFVQGLRTQRGDDAALMSVLDAFVREVVEPKQAQKSAGEGVVECNVKTEPSLTLWESILAGDGGAGAQQQQQQQGSHEQGSFLASLFG
ncbi:hypothetical protein H9P43_002387 [Blastocladiella emersonii ATCC 22665]|nr:hypothetical protein H9P43_002387 [Blastocladiella emersonii ATCC 22665]